MKPERYRFRAWHEELNTCYYITVVLYKYGIFGIPYRVAKMTGRSSFLYGQSGIQEEQDYLKAEMLRKLDLVPV